jgi:predicted dehydrogenase
MHSDLHRHVADVLKTGAIGSVRRIELRIGRPDCALGNDGWMPRWRTDLARAGGGIILDHGWHQLYLLLAWMRGPIESVSAITRTADSRHYPVEDEALLEMRFPGAHGRIELSWTAHGRSNDGLITGSRGAVTIQDDRIVVHSGGGYHSLPFRGKLTESSYHPDWFAQMFRRTILDESRDEADRNFAEAGVLVSAICAAYRSAHRSGAPCSPTFPTGDAVSAALTARMDSIYERGIGGGAAASQSVV